MSAIHKVADIIGHTDFTLVNAANPSKAEVIFFDGTRLEGAQLEAIRTAIEEHQSAEIDPLTLPLSAAQFEAGLVILGVDHDAIEPAIKQAISDPVQQAFALGRWRRLVTIERDNATLALLKAVFSVTDEQIDDMWRTVSQVN